MLNVFVTLKVSLFAMLLLLWGKQVLLLFQELGIGQRMGNLGGYKKEGEFSTEHQFSFVSSVIHLISRKFFSSQHSF